MEGLIFRILQYCIIILHIKNEYFAPQHFFLNTAKEKRPHASRGIFLTC